MTEPESAPASIDHFQAIGAELRRRREARGMSLADLAKGTHYSRGYLSRIENGHMRLTRRIAEVCDTALGTGSDLVDLVMNEHAEPRRAITPPRVDLPSPASFFFGRERDLADIVDLLSDRSPGRRRVVALHGLPGAGKTELAVQAANEVVERYDAGLFLDLHGYTAPLDPVDVMNRVVRRLGVPGEVIPYDADEQIALYRRTVRQRHLLLIFDNARDAGQVFPLLVPGHSDIIVTSRLRLSALDEAAHRLVGEIDPVAARRLFVRVAGLTTPDSETGEQIDRIVGYCGHLALPVRAAAARLSAVGGLDELARRLAGSGAAAALADGPRSVDAALTSAYLALPPAAARALLLLTLHPGQDFDERALGLLANLPNATRMARDLVDSALLRRLSDGRLGFHDLVRSILTERAGHEMSPGEAAAAIRRLLAGVLHTTQHADLLITPGRFRVPAVTPDPPAPIVHFAHRQAAARWLEEEQHNLARLVEVAADAGMPETSWKLAYALRDFYFRTKRWAAWIRTHEVALTAATACGDRWAIAVTRNNLGLAYAETERFADAQEQYAGALELFREIGDQYGEANTLGHQAWVMYCLGRFREAGEMCWAALDIYETEGLRRNAAITLRTLALAESARSMYRLALEHLGRALAIFGEEGLLLDETMAHNCLGEVYARTADLASARRHFRLAQRRGVRSASTFERARALRGLAGVALATGRPEQAERFSRQAESLYAGQIPAPHRPSRPRWPLDDPGAGR
ncbi:tetratricopeptide repeat protein [Paractinoplanes toevensis]|uniref:HTH cro/C1-type domain-containing protein n=1 Tax=Paractinoplanes toevensis TaxID=571911 RepID=A0A919T9F9_9ACTN|nr:tetratricopeptide repeat protein [Actinoplanes toevensis]GIM90310.1 hypothetical protein Ato02nite_021030 [Actinoplanes toevensis]